MAGPLVWASSLGASHSGLPSSPAREVRACLDKLSSWLSQAGGDSSRRAAAGSTTITDSPPRHLSPCVEFDLDSEEVRPFTPHGAVGVSLKCLPVPHPRRVVRLAILVLETLRCTPLLVLTPSSSSIKNFLCPLPVLWIR